MSKDRDYDAAWLSDWNPITMMEKTNQIMDLVSKDREEMAKEQLVCLMVATQRLVQVWLGAISRKEPEIRENVKARCIETIKATAKLIEQEKFI